MIGKLHKSDNNLFVKCWQKPAAVSFTYEHWYLVNEKSKIPCGLSVNSSLALSFSLFRASESYPRKKSG